MASSSLSFNNIQRYNNLRDFLINYEGYTYKQLFGLKYQELDGLFYGDASTVYKVTNSKRAWLRVQLDRFVDFFDLQEGWAMIDNSMMTDSDYFKMQELILERFQEEQEDEWDKEAKEYAAQLEEEAAHQAWEDRISY